MKKNLKVSLSNKCIGCELCVFECQRQLGKTGLNGSPIRIFRKRNEQNNFVEFSIELDPRISDLEIEKIVDICPAEVFEISEEEPYGLLE